MPAPRNLLLGLVGVVMVVLSSAVMVSAAPSQADPRKQREEVRQQQALVAADVNGLTASAEEAAAALQVLAANVATQQARVDDATRQAADAAVAAQTARDAQQVAQDKISALKGKLKDVAVESYVKGGDKVGADDTATFQSGGGVSNELQTQVYLELQASKNQDLIDQMRAAQEELGIQRKAAEDAQTLADQKLAEAAAHKAELDKALAAQQKLTDEIDDRLDSRLSEAAGLEAQDKALSDQIRAQDAFLAALRARASSGSSTRPGRGASRPPSGSLGSVRAYPSGSITVDASIVANLQNMVDAAHGAGINLAGGGFRDSAQQIALRRSHCGSSNSDIFDKPASQCSPPTARPGASMHEKGLAIDFTCNGGGSIGSRSSPCFRWLDGNAASYGFFNLPSEPWHWSTNGN